jgi:Porin subfamily
MRMVKSILLGSAAGLVAVTAGQAADLPVKAQPVQYVKVCNMYGAGFYYMPGTDFCIKIGGYVRAEVTEYSGGNMSQGPVQGNVNSRATSNLTMRARGYITADAREQTAYGTARAYIAVGIATSDVGQTLIPSILGFNRAYVQWAGFTAGQAQSFYDFYSAPAMGYRGYLPSSDTGDSGWWVWAYTANLGGGLSATISAEQRRAAQMCDVVAGAFSGGGSSGGACSIQGDIASTAAAGGSTGGGASNPFGYGGNVAPDVVANIRLDQAWGSAQIMGAAHNDNAPYYGTVPVSGGPSDTWGFVVGAGLKINFPMIAPGDYFQSQVNYTQGAVRYVDMGGNSPSLWYGNGNSAAFGTENDCTYGATAAGTVAAPTSTGTTGCNLTTAWGVNVGYEHYWTPNFHESFIGNYTAFSYNTQANALLCVVEGAGTGTGSASLATAGCNNNWDMWSAATRLQYDVTKSLYFGVEVLYQHFDTAQLPGGTMTAPVAALEATGAAVTGATLKGQDNVAITARIHKDFLP